MAMTIPKSGISRFMKDGSMHFKGVEEAVTRNIEACVELASQLRSAFGPNGMNKMIINNLENLFVTNNAVTILNELEVQHPAARMVIMAAQMQQKQIGDFTNTVVILAASLLEKSLRLLEMGIKPIEVAAGYERAFSECEKILPGLVVAKATDLYNVDEVKKWLGASVASKQAQHHLFLTELVAKACVQIVPKKNAYSFNVDNIRVLKIIGSGIGSSFVQNGMAFKRGAEGELKKVSNARIVIFACPFDLTQTETKGTVLMSTAGDLLDFSHTEELEVEAQVKALADAGVNVVVAAGKFGDLYSHFLNRFGIMGVRLTSKFDLRRLCNTTGAQAQSRICSPLAESLGQCDEVYVKEIGDTQVVVFDKHGETVRVATVVIRGSSQAVMDDAERAVDNAVNVYKALLTKDIQLLPGGGAVEVVLARAVTAIGEKCSGLEQYAIREFAAALEVFPKKLAENAGLKSEEVFAKLCSIHQKGEIKNVGVNVLTGKLEDMAEAGIFDLFSGKLLALKLAVNAATTVLQIDQIIMAKPVGGPKPRGPGAQDEDDSIDAGMA